MTEKPYESLLANDSPEIGIWHGRPRGTHAFGVLHDVPPEAASDGATVTTDLGTPESAYWPSRHWPAIALSTIYTITLDAVNIWFESPHIARGDYERTRMNWRPTHLDLAWRAGDIEVEVMVASVAGDAARFKVTVTNHGDAPVAGQIIVRGDGNSLNSTCRGQDWGKSDRTNSWIDNVAVTSRHVQLGLGLEYFPFFKILTDDDRQYEWVSMYEQSAVAVEGDGWMCGEADSGHGATWQFDRACDLACGGVEVFDVALVGAWCGKNPPTRGSDKAIAQRAAKEFAQITMHGAIDDGRALWRDFFDRVPAPTHDWPEAWIRLYYKAWSSVYYNVVQPTDWLFYDSPNHQGACCKVAPSTMAMCPATWESSLIALMLSLVDPALGQDVLEGVFVAQETDGYVGEMPGNVRSTQLPCVEPFVAWACYRASGDKAFLDRMYPKLLANLRYKAYHPTWMHHGVFMVRNYAYARIGALYLTKIAQALGRDSKELSELARMADHLQRAVNTYWDEDEGCFRANLIPIVGLLGHAEIEEGTDAEALIPLFRCCREDQAQRLCELIEKEYMTDIGVLRRKPLTLKRAMSGTWKSANKHGEFSLKESNWMFLPKAVKDHDAKLFDRIARGTLTNIRKAGDFYECYTFDGRGRHNGPGSIFGAFAVIWAILLSEGVVDHLYD